MQNTEVRSHRDCHNFTSCLGLILLLGLLISAGCGKSDGKEASDNKFTPSPVVKKLSAEAARMELAKLGKDYSPEEFVKSAANGDKMAIELFLAAGMDVNVKMFDGRTALLLASMDGRDELVQYLLDLGADPNVESRDEGNALSDGWTPLIFAAFQGHTNVVKQLIAKGANIEAKTPEGVTPLIAAIKHGQPEGVRIMLDHGASVSTKIGKGFTPLMLAVSGENPDVQIVKLILAKQPDLEAKTDNGATAMDDTTDPTVRELLRNAGARTITDLVFAGIWKEMSETKTDMIARQLHAGLGRRPGDQPDQDALKLVRSFFSDETNKAERDQGYSNFQIAQMLLLVWDTIKRATVAAFMFGDGPPDRPPSDAQKKIMKQYDQQSEDCWKQFETVYLEVLRKGEMPVDSFRWNGMPILSLASAQNRIELVKALLEHGSDVNLKDKEGLTALDYAKQNNEKDIEHLLRMARALAFLLSVEKNDMEKVKACLAGRVDANTGYADGMTALMIASSRGYPQIAKVLLDSRANPNARNTNGLTALMYASSLGYAQIAEFLIKGGAAVDAITFNGATALMLATNAEVAKVLLDNGANPNATNTNGVSALVYASVGGYPQIIKLLIQSGAAVDETAPDGRTALMRATNVDTAKVLLDSGANPNSKNTNGDSPLLFAAANGNAEVVKLLLDSGAVPDAVDNGGATAMNVAAKIDNVEIIPILLAKGARIDLAINQGKNEGQTALMIAAKFGSTNSARLLLEKGADRNLKDVSGKTAADYAQRGGHAGIVKLLTETGPIAH